jgi:serine/threonine-protein kinase
MAVPPELEAIVLMLLEKDPARRYASADDLRADLRRYREGFKVMAMQPAAPTAMATTAAPVVESTQAIPVAHQTRAVVGVPVEDLPREYVPEREKRSWGFLVALVLLLGVLIVLLVLLAKTLGVGEDDGTDVPQIAVPDLSGQGITEDAARATLLAPNCTDTDPATGATTRVPCFVVGTTQFEEVDRPELVGTVIAQDPEGGTNVDQGTTVTLTVGAQNQIVIPEVAGSTPDEAAATLAQEGFTAPPQQREESSDEVEAGQVIGTDPPAGTEAPADAVITLIVSSGPPPIPIPDCAGRSVDECIGRLEQAGFTHTEQGESSDSVPEGTVLRLSPAEGTEAPVGTNVTIVVSSGPASVTVPPVVGLDRDAAIEALEDAGFDVDVQPQAVAPGDPDDGKVISQNPEGNDEAEPGSTVTIVVGQAVTDPGGGNGNGGGGGNG